MVQVSNTRIDREFRTGADTSPVRGFYAQHIKQALDIALILIAAPVVVPVIVLLALLVGLDGGPAFYTQTRVGKNGRVFQIWKLRTMVIDADARLKAYLAANPEARAEWDRTQKLKKDPRITLIGRLLRKTSLDELPQLWNVLKGDMSLVGPRPMLPGQAQLYPGRAYYQLRPGITGFWQISDRNDSAFAARAVHDTNYARQMSLRTDVAVLMSTVAVVLRGTGY